MVSTITESIENRVVGNGPMSIRLPRELRVVIQRRARETGESEATLIRLALRDMFGAPLIESR